MTDSVEALVARALDVRPLASALPVPVRLAAIDRESCRQAVDRLFPAIGLAPPVWVDDADRLSVFEALVGAHLDVAALDDRDLAAFGEAELGDRVVRCARRGFEGVVERHLVPSGDGVVVRAYVAGRGGGEPVLLIGAPGMPAELHEGWLRALSATRPVVHWETRGLFGDGAPLALERVDLRAQVGDAMAILDTLDLAAVHVVALCGGAVIGLALAAAHPTRVTSLSVWHGDFELGDDAPKTSHQGNLGYLMSMVAEGKVAASSLHATLSESMVASAPNALAHLVVYPYATPELLSLYCRLNNAIMSADCRRYLPSVQVPALVVTSDDDLTAHPDGSRYVARHLPRGSLHVLATGDHLSLFSAPPPVISIAEEFLSRALVRSEVVETDILTLPSLESSAGSQYSTVPHGL